MVTKEKNQSVYIVRYGLTKFPLLESVGPFNSDIDPTEGVKHAKCIAKCIATDNDPPVVVYSSPFTRCAHTAQLIALELPNPAVRIEEGLTEWLIPSLLVEPNGVKTYPKTVAELAVIYGTIDDTYQPVNPVVADDATDVPEGSPHFEESEEALMKRCKTTMQRMLDDNKGDSFAIVSHAPCDQSIAYFLEGCSSPAASQLRPWPLGGITKFTRTANDDGSFGPWTLDKYGITEHMPGKYQKGFKHWSLPCLDK